MRDGRARALAARHLTPPTVESAAMQHFRRSTGERLGEAAAFISVRRDPRAISTTFLLVLLTEGDPRAPPAQREAGACFFSNLGGDMSEDGESGKERLLRLLEPFSGRATEDGMILLTAAGQILRTDDGDVLLVDLEESHLADLLSQIRAGGGGANR